MATLTELLADAQTAYHALLTGRQAVEIRDSNGETLRYTPANANKLAAYIEELKRQIAVDAGECPNVGPMRVFM